MTNPDNSNAQTLSEKQLNAVQYILNSRTITEAAEKSGYSRNTIHEWLRIPAFKDEIHRQREIAVEGALLQLQLNVVKAVDTLGAVLDNPNAHLHFRRNVSLDIIKYVVKIREQSKIADLEKRIEELEEQLSDLTAEDNGQ